MITKITNITHTIRDDPYGDRHDFGLTLTNLNNDQAVIFWDFIGKLHVDDEPKLEPVWSQTQKTDDEPDEDGMS